MCIKVLIFRLLQVFNTEQVVRFWEGGEYEGGKEANYYFIVYL